MKYKQLTHKCILELILCERNNDYELLFEEHINNPLPETYCLFPLDYVKGSNSCIPGPYSLVPAKLLS